MWKRILLSIALVFGLAGASQAATLFAGPIRAGTGAQLVCAIVNVGKKSVTNIVITPMTDTAGGGPVADLAPGEDATGSNVVGGISSVNAWCRFDFKGGKKSVRATACVRAMSGAAESCFAVAVAQ